MASVLNPNSGPFNGRLLVDSNYSVSQSVSGSPVTFDFVQATPFPTVTDKVNFVVTVLSNIAAASASVYIQDSPDGTTWTNIAALAAPLVSVTSVATQGTVSASFNVEPTAKRYLRASASYAGTAQTYALVAYM